MKRVIEEQKQDDDGRPQETGRIFGIFFTKEAIKTRFYRIQKGTYQVGLMN